VAKRRKSRLAHNNRGYVLPAIDDKNHEFVKAQTTAYFQKQENTNMDDNQIRHMVNRFLTWRIPQGFSPDHNIHFEGHTEHGPVGTNLFTATQAEGMIRHMLQGLPPAAQNPAPVDMDDLLNRPVKDYTQPALRTHYDDAGFDKKYVAGHFAEEDAKNDTLSTAMFGEDDNKRRSLNIGKDGAVKSLG